MQVEYAFIADAADAAGNLHNRGPRRAADRYRGQWTNRVCPPSDRPNAHLGGIDSFSGVGKCSGARAPTFSNFTQMAGVCAKCLFG